MSPMPKGRPTTLRERNNVECPECGSILTRSRGGGRSDEDHRLRRRICEECRLIFTTVEVPILYENGSPVPLVALDSDYRRRKRQGGRLRVGYHGTQAGRHPYARSAQLDVSVTVREPQRVAKAGPWPLDDKQPFDPAAWRAAHREELNARNREWMRRKRAADRARREEAVA